MNLSKQSEDKELFFEENTENLLDNNIILPSNIIIK
jgi:hypothetical protein